MILLQALKMRCGGIATELPKRRGNEGFPGSSTQNEGKGSRPLPPQITPGSRYRAVLFLEFCRLPFSCSHVV